MARMTQAIKDQAIKIHQQRDVEINRALGNDNLSAQGQKIAVAKAHVAAQRAMDDLQNNMQAGAQLTADDVQKRLFGSTSTVSGADAVSMRDANDRVSQLGVGDADQASTMMQTALLTGDTHLSQAIARQAYAYTSGMPFAPRGWAEVLNTYADANPKFASQLEQYQDATASWQADGLEQFVFILPVPSMLAGIHPNTLERFADEG